MNMSGVSMPKSNAPIPDTSMQPKWSMPMREKSAPMPESECKPMPKPMPMPESEYKPMPKPMPMTESEYKPMPKPMPMPESECKPIQPVPKPEPRPVPLPSPKQMPEELKPKTCVPGTPQMVLAMAYVLDQMWESVYEPDVALGRGTLFPDLDKPFIGEEMPRK